MGNAWTTLWNHDKIKAEAVARGGAVEKQFGKAYFGYYVNRLPGFPFAIGVTYRSETHYFGPLSLVGHEGSANMWGEDDFLLFCKNYNDVWAGMSMPSSSEENVLQEYFKFVIWACQHAHIVTWEVWT